MGKRDDAWEEPTTTSLGLACNLQPSPAIAIGLACVCSSLVLDFLGSVTNVRSTPGSEVLPRAPPSAQLKGVKTDCQTAGPRSGRLPAIS